MKGDFSRITFDPARQYRRVLQQQGRVALDSDQNEQAEIQAYLEETGLYDVIGDSGAPYHWEGPDHGDGFEIFAGPPHAATDAAPATEILIGSGRYYLHGKLAENAAEDVTLDAQIGPGPFADGRYVAYLDAWERLITAVENPDLREIALGGPDTATRVVADWRVRVAKVADDAECTDFASSWTPDPRTLPSMSVVTVPTDPGSDPCLLPVSGGYQGLENQLYRVEIHALAPAVLKWSRDNASLCATVTQVDSVAKVITLSSLGMDPMRTLDTSPLLEIVTEDDIANRRSGLLLESFERISEDRIRVLDASVSGADLAARNGAVIRAWDGKANAVGGKVDVPLENGISVQFDEIDFRVGDYWVFAARALSNNVLWPTGEFQPPKGEMHNYAVLALLDRTDPNWQRVSDCRHLFTPLTESIRLTYVCGDGQEAMPGFALFQPLTVAVFNGLWPEVAADVRFAVISGDATISATDVSTNGSGLASVTAVLHNADSSVVEARLLNTDGDPVDAPIRFNLNLSKADLVEYTPGACPALAGQNTVQAAIDRLRSLRRLTYEGGDGQIVTFAGGSPEVLPQPLMVCVSNLCGPREKDTVEFKASAGTVSADGSSFAVSVNVETDAEGLAQCFWMPDKTPDSQVVVARLSDAEGVEQQCQVVFNAQIVRADDVAFSTQCPLLQGANDVQEALDALCPRPHLYLMGGAGQTADGSGNLAKPIVVRVLAGGSIPMPGMAVDFTLDSGEGSVNPSTATTDANGYATAVWRLGPSAPEQVLSAKVGFGETVFVTASKASGASAPKQGIVVREIRIGGEAIQNDEFVPISALMKGVLVIFDHPVDPACVAAKPVGDVILMVPGSNDASRVTAFSGSSSDIAAFLPQFVAGTWSIDSNDDRVVRWEPTARARGWLEAVGAELKEKYREGIEMRIELRGWAIWSTDKEKKTRIYLDGITLGEPVSGRTHLRFGTTAGLPGSNFQSWFILVDTVAQGRRLRSLALRLITEGPQL
jgi:hypothetical protein